MKISIKLIVPTLLLLGLIFAVPQPVAATLAPPPTLPAAGDWVWDAEDITVSILPQYTLAPAEAEDYALLQSNGIHVSRATQLCHPYPGGQFGWTAEIRALTATGWQPVPTVNQWVPDEEGKFMTCAQVWASGTYAVFGYWEKPEGWGIVGQVCETAPEGYVDLAPASEIGTLFPAFADYDQCDKTGNQPGWFWNGSNAWLFLNGYYCACDTVYQDPNFEPSAYSIQ